MYRRKPDEPASLPQGTKNYFLPKNTPALAVAAGKVLIAKNITTGGYVRLQHAGGLITQYMHLQRLDVKEGQTVKQGQVLGIVGGDVAPGRYPLWHLHFEILEDGSKVDPEPYLSRWTKTAATVGMFSIPLAIAIGVGFWYFRKYRT